MKIVHLIGNVALWIGALLGVVAGGLFVANKLDVVNPLIVISGSMEPGIHTGDMLIDVKVDTAGLEVGDVVSLPSDLTHKLVSHRITHIEPSSDGPDGTSWKIYMQGDANEFEDIAPYYVGDSVWSPKMRLPGMGFVVSKMMNPAFSLPIVLALGALLGISLLAEPRRDDEDEDDVDDDVDPDHGRLDGEPVRERQAARSAALDEIDLALAALGVKVDDVDEPDARTTELERQPLELVLSS